MKMYEVGGCVRDTVLGFAPSDIDYVVVGSTEEEMLSLGYERVGVSFPVFLKNGHEYALARTERKTGVGYNGFSVDASADTSLEDDLMRRDLTINSIAKDMVTGELIDPFGGLKDLEDGVLRPTSDAFMEDPLRVLRLFRFKVTLEAKTGKPWLISDTARNMSVQVLKHGELFNLPPDRIRIEFEKVAKVAGTKGVFEFANSLTSVGGTDTTCAANALSCVYPALAGMIPAIRDVKFADAVKDLPVCLAELAVAYGKKAWKTPRQLPPSLEYAMLNELNFGSDDSKKFALYTRIELSKELEDKLEVLHELKQFHDAETTSYLFSATASDGMAEAYSALILCGYINWAWVESNLPHLTALPPKYRETIIKLARLAECNRKIR